MSIKHIQKLHHLIIRFLNITRPTNVSEYFQLQIIFLHLFMMNQNFHAFSISKEVSVLIMYELLNFQEIANLKN